jgi:hypothetical protein
MDFDKWYARIESDLNDRSFTAKDGNRVIAIETLQRIVSKHYGGDPRTKRSAIRRLIENDKLKEMRDSKTLFIFLDGNDRPLESKQAVEKELIRISRGIKA